MAEVNQVETNQNTGVAGSQGNPNEGSQSNQNGQNGGNQGEGRTFTQDEVNQFVKERLEREQAKMKAEITAEVTANVNSKQTEAKKLEQMNDAERAQYELDKSNEEKAELQRKLDRIETKQTVTSMLSEKGIPAGEELLGMLVHDGVSAEDTKERVNAFVELFNSMVDEKVTSEVKTKLSGRTPSGSSNNQGAAQSVGEQIAKEANTDGTKVKIDLWD